MTTTHIPPHLREEIFRRYEPLIASAVTAWPNESSFLIPDNIAPTTFVANFRNAILSLRSFKWETYIDCDKMWSLGRSFVISQDSQGVVWFRKRSQPGRPNTLTAEARNHLHTDPEPQPPSRVVPWRDATDGEIASLCLLLSNKRLTGTFIIDRELSSELTAQLMDNFDVALVYDPMTSQTTIV